jgi:hypothetical protein
MKELLLGIVLIVIIGFGGLVYRNAVEHPNQPVACPMDAKLCPDGSSVARTGSSCTFAECLPPNVSLPVAGISFALPDGFHAAELVDTASVATYEGTAAASTTAPRITIRRYEVASSTTALAVIQQTAIGGASGLPISVTSFSSSVFGGRRFTIVSIERFEGVIDTAYYLARGADVVRFDAMDTGVAGWTDPSLDISALPAHRALAKLLSTIQGQ